MKISPVVLCILDGWGYREDAVDNALKQANLPNYSRYWNSASRSWLKTSGLAVGLPDGQMGNSEVGHTNIGSGRVVMQDLPRIDSAVSSGSLADEDALVDHINALKKSGGSCHLMGLLSDGGVHSHIDHMIALADIVSTAGVPVKIHAFLDGRDTPPKSAEGFLNSLSDAVADMASDSDKADVTIATLCGRYFAMDRDQRWDRVSTAYHAIATATADTRSITAIDALKKAYSAEKYDEFMPATLIGDYKGMADGDGLLMANFRADRAREILAAFVDPAFDDFDTGPRPRLANKTGMVGYSNHLDQFMSVIFTAPDIEQSLGEVVSKAGLNQLRIAETEKYAHVTFFFNGGKEDVFDGEDRILVPSPNVATYDLQPEMSAPEVTDKLVEAINSDKYSSIIVNYANPDMVGHTGIMSAAIKAVECVDDCLGRVEQAVIKAGGSLLITADHGNVELMRNQETGAPHTAHTSFDVPLVALGLPEEKSSLKDGALSDLAPTILSLLDLKQPSEMTGKSLLD